MYWLVMRRMGRSDGSFLTGHMWLIRIGPHGAPDTLKMTTAPQELLYVISALVGGAEKQKRKSKNGPELNGSVLIHKADGYKSSSITCSEALKSPVADLGPRLIKSKKETVSRINALHLNLVHILGARKGIT